MPFDLRLVRSAPRPIRREEFHALFAAAPGEKRGEDLYWITGQGEPWFAAEWDEGEVVLSTSYGNGRFLRNFAALFDIGLGLAGQLDAQLVEQVGGQVMSAAGIDALVTPQSPYVKQQTALFRRAQEQISEAGQAPLEYPLAGVDVVPEFLLFYVRGGQDGGEPALGGKGLEVVAADTDAWLVQEEGRWLTRVLRRPDGVWQIWPAWGQARFARLAEVTLGSAERVLASVGGELQFLGRACDTRRREEIRAQSRGLGVDFYEWAEDLDDDDEAANDEN